MATAPVPDFSREVYRGDDYGFSLEYRDENGTPIDLTGYSARMQLRPSVTDQRVLVELTSDPDGGITIDGPNGVVSVAFTGAQMRLEGVSRVAHDVQLTDTGGGIKTLVRGEFTIVDDITRNGGTP